MLLFAHWIERESKIIVTTGWTTESSTFDITINDLSSGDIIFNGWVMIPKYGFTPIEISREYTENPSFSGLSVKLFKDGNIIYQRNIDSKNYNEIKSISIGDFQIHCRENEHITANIKHFNDFWEWDHMEQFLKHLNPTGKILDIGANIGNHTLMFKKYFPNAEIFSFEPLFYNYELLQKNVHSYRDINIFKVALSDRHDILKINNNFQEFNSGAASVSDRGESVLALPLDSLEMSDVSFIKIDVEGWEPQVIRGAIKTMEQNRPKIWLEDGNGNTVKFLVENLGYFVQDKRGGENYLLSPKI